MPYGASISSLSYLYPSTILIVLISLYFSRFHKTHLDQMNSTLYVFDCIPQDETHKELHQRNPIHLYADGVDSIRECTMAFRRGPTVKESLLSRRCCQWRNYH